MSYRHIADIVRNQNPVTLSPDATVQHACRRMRVQQVGAVLVMRRGRLVGIFTRRDACTRVLAEGRDASTTKLREVMTSDPWTLPPGQSVIDALRLMFEHGFRHLPVVEDDRIVGVVSHGDFKGIEIDRLDDETALKERIW